METLLDRIQIEDFITRYYYDLSVGKSHELADYFTADALLDVDSTIARGHAEIGKLYERPEAAAESPALYEQGREYTELVKVDGKWLISARYITSDSGLPDRFDATFKPREHR